jgi:RNA polymerase sigma-70 factor (ECF subfamily)
MLHQINNDGTDFDALLDRIERGEVDLFLHVVRRHELSLRGYLAGQLYDMADVDDLSQDVFVTAFRDLSSYRRGGDFGAWLRGIARHRLLTHFRSRQRRVRAEEQFQEEFARIAATEIEDGAGRQSASQIERLLHCILQLPDKLRRVVHAGLEGNKPAVLAEELGTTVPAIYQLHYRANQLLRDCLTKEVRS